MKLYFKIIEIWGFSKSFNKTELNSLASFVDNDKCRYNCERVQIIENTLKSGKVVA